MRAKKYEIATQLRLMEITHAKLKYIAKKELRSLNGQMEYYLQKGVEEYEAAHGKIEITEQ